MLCSILLYTNAFDFLQNAPLVIGVCLGAPSARIIVCRHVIRTTVIVTAARLVTMETNVALNVTQTVRIKSVHRTAANVSAVLTGNTVIHARIHVVMHAMIVDVIKTAASAMVVMMATMAIHALYGAATLARIVDVIKITATVTSVTPGITVISVTHRVRVVRMATACKVTVIVAVVA